MRRDTEGVIVCKIIIVMYTNASIAKSTCVTRMVLSMFKVPFHIKSRSKISLTPLVLITIRGTGTVITVHLVRLLHKSTYLAKGVEMFQSLES